MSNLPMDELKIATRPSRFVDNPPGLLSDRDIMALCHPDGDRPMIQPFSQKLSGEGVISHGLSSVGYDATLAPTFKIFTNVNGTVLDPKNFDEKCFVNHEGDYCIIPPNGFILCHTKEYFKMPYDVASICIGKSTYARLGLNVMVTPLEPGWEGQVTIEIANNSPLPAKVYAHEGVCQFLFLRTVNRPMTTYDARGGKYMGQQGIVLPKILQSEI